MMDELAEMAADYYTALLKRNIPDEMARQLVLDWQAAMLGHAHFVLMERNMGIKGYAKYYTGVVKNFINVTRGIDPQAVAREVTARVNRQWGVR